MGKIKKILISLIILLGVGFVSNLAICGNVSALTDAEGRALADKIQEDMEKPKRTLASAKTALAAIKKLADFPSKQAYIDNTQDIIDAFIADAEIDEISDAEDLLNDPDLTQAMIDELKEHIDSLADGSVKTLILEKIATAETAFNATGTTNVYEETCNDPATYNPVVCDDPADPLTLMGVIKIIINTLLYILASVSVLMLVIGGVRYGVSGGNEKGVTGAKNSILYAVVGLVVALSGFAIINFVLSAL